MRRRRLTSAGSEPLTTLGASRTSSAGSVLRGVDYTLGRGLFHMVQRPAFPPDITFNQPVRARGKSKRLLELSVAEAGHAFVDAGLITPEELEHTLVSMQHANADETVLAVMPRMSQVWARKPAHT